MKKRILALSVALCLLISSGVGGTASAAEQDGSTGVLATDDLSEYANGEVLVGYQDGSFEVLSYENDEALADGLKTLSENQDVSLIQPNYSYTSSALSTTDPLANQQWALSNNGSFQMEEEENQYPVYDQPFEDPSMPGQWTTPGYFDQPGGSHRAAYIGNTATAQQTSAVAGIDINAETAWSVYDGGKRDVIIALIDTGVDTSHVELQDAIWVNEDEIPGNGIDDDGNGYIDDVNGWNFYDNSNQLYVSSTDDSHGTHGAGTIAASANNGTGIAGIVQSDHVKIMVVKALGGSDGGGTTESIIKAIQYAQANGASICNLSLGTSSNDWALYRTIANSSMLFVVAAGNDGANTDTSPCYPASYDLDNIISVANLNYDGALHYSSNYGAVSVDLAAPGSYILSTTPNNSYSYMTGTSMAAPMVTAAAAMVYSYYENITLPDVKEILLSSTRTLDSLSGNTATGGMLDLGAAMTYDLSKLSGQVWNLNASTGSGTAPRITTTTGTWQNKTYLIVKVTDVDGDLAATAYASGTLSAEQFKNGSVGNAFTVGSDGTVVFSVTGNGTYTFYALDRTGNETTETVTVSYRSQWPSLWGGGSGRWMENGTTVAPLSDEE